jgi:hypothetical protein
MSECSSEKEKKKLKKKGLSEGGLKEEDGEKRLCSFGTGLTDYVVIIKRTDF